MTVILILTALVLPLALLYLTVAANEFEKSTRQLGEAIRKRYVYEPPQKTGAAEKAMKSMVKLPGKP
ncbi:MAG TPA: hypothetical protein VJ385_20750 [Fibrobacteria bacterium]|nr:hypothetical protein [Fibrobacteria bacterium]